MVAQIKFSVAVALLVMVAGCSGENKPTETQLREALVLELPGYVKITDFSVDAMQNTGNEVEPNYIARFSAKLETTSELYTRDGSEGNLLFLKKASDLGTSTEVFGKSSSTLYQGGWAHDLFVEGNTLRELGKPQAEFTAEKTLVRGSAEETAYYESLKVQDAEFETTTASLPLHDMVSEYYDTASEWAGRYQIHEVFASRLEKRTNEEFLVHAKYSYREPTATVGQGEDRRAFTVRNLEGTWQVVGMGSAGSGRLK